MSDEQAASPRTPKAWLLLFLKGMAMGAADVVPGVSGGTIALMTNIYQELIDTLQGVSLKLLLIWRQDGFRRAWRAMNGTFLCVLGLGVITSIASFARIISYLLEHHPIPLWGFFFGLILISAVVVARHLSCWHWQHVAVLVTGIAIAYGITLLSPASAATHGWMVFLSGYIAICAMILPGISGSFILLLMGMYTVIVGAIKSFDVLILGIFISGCLLGLLSFSRVLSWLLKRYYDTTIALLIGFMLGSLNKVWPWKHTVSFRINSQGEQVPLLQDNVLPWLFSAQTQQDAHLLSTLMAAIVAILLVVILERISIKST